MISDEDLMSAFQRGSREAFDALFERYRGPLYGFFRRRLAMRERAQDLTQDTFIAVMRGSARYVPSALVRTYLYGIALKLLAAERRRQAKDGLPGPARELQSEETHDESLWVQQALTRLDAQEREVLMLREYEELSYAEIAELLNIPVNTVRSRLFRSRLALKACLEPERCAQREG